MRFLYLRDPLFLCVLVTYFVNRQVLEPRFGWTFCTHYLNDCICMPFWVTIMVSVARLMRLRRTNVAPLTHEVLIPLLVFCILFELVLPQLTAFRGVAIGDPWDVVCYCAGALFATVYWAWRYPRPRL